MTPAEAREEWIARQLADWPPLSPEQLDVIRRALGSAQQSEPVKRAAA